MLVMRDSFIDIYNNSIPIDRIKNLNDSNYKIFKLKTNGLPVKLTDTRDNKLLYELSGINPSYYNFINNYKVFWTIPIETINNNVCGYILRCFKETKLFNQKYSIYKNNYKIPPLLFGWYDFDDFEYGTPIILTESAKDALVIKTIYKYTLALNTSSIKLEILNILKYFTNNVILIYDNDRTGVKKTQWDKSLLIGNGIKTRDIKIPFVKDAAELYKNILLYNSFKDVILKMVIY